MFEFTKTQSSVPDFGSILTPLREVVSYTALCIFASLYVKKQAFCTSNLLYQVEDELTIYSSLWSYRQINGLAHRVTKPNVCQLLLLLCGDVEICHGPNSGCGLCLKTVRRNQSRISCSTCPSIFHLSCHCCSLTDIDFVCQSCKSSFGLVCLINKKVST